MAQIGVSIAIGARMHRMPTDRSLQFLLFPLELLNFGALAGGHGGTHLAEGTHLLDNPLAIPRAPRSPGRYPNVPHHLWTTVYFPRTQRKHFGVLADNANLGCRP